jgi:hypothetical protein
MASEQDVRVLAPVATYASAAAIPPRLCEPRAYARSHYRPRASERAEAALLGPQEVERRGTAPLVPEVFRCIAAPSTPNVMLISNVIYIYIYVYNVI